MKSEKDLIVCATNKEAYLKNNSATKLRRRQEHAEQKYRVVIYKHLKCVY